MNIGDLIKQYRIDNAYSMRDFADKCKVSHSYIAMLESKKNSKTGEPIVPSITALNKIAKGLDMSINDLVSICDDMPVVLSYISRQKSTPTEGELDEGEKIWLDLYHRISEDSRDMLVKLVDAFDNLPAEERKFLLSVIELKLKK